MKIAHVNIFGEVSPFEVSLKSVKDALAAVPDHEEIHVHIHSPGGDVIEGFAIYDALLASGKKVKTFVEGLSGSIASVIMMAGTDREATPNSQVFIHNPWGITGGDSAEVQKYADTLKEWEAKILAVYATRSGKPEEDFKPLMAAETFLDITKAKELNLITAETKITVKASFKPIIPADPNPNTPFMKTLLDDIKALTASVKALVTGQEDKPKALALTGKDGKTYTTDTDAALAAGQVVKNADGTVVAAGEIVLADDTKITIAADGKIEKVEAAPAAETVEALKAKIVALEAAAQENVQTKAALEELKTVVATMSSTYKPQAKQTQFGNRGNEEAAKLGDKTEMRSRRDQYKKPGAPAAK